MTPTSLSPVTTRVILTTTLSSSKDDSESKRDQEEGGGAQERSRAGRWSWALIETKSREGWAHIESWTIICGSRRDLKRAQESWTLTESWTILRFTESFIDSCLVSDIVFVTLLRTAVEVHKLLGTGGVPASVVVAVADGLFGLYWSEGRDQLCMGTRSPLSPVPDKPCVLLWT